MFPRFLTSLFFVSEEAHCEEAVAVKAADEAALLIGGGLGVFCSMPMRSVLETRKPVDDISWHNTLEAALYRLSLFSEQIAVRYFADPPALPSCSSYLLHAHRLQYFLHRVLGR